MKTSILVLLVFLVNLNLTVAQTPDHHSNIIRVGIAPTTIGEDGGITFFNELQFGIGNRLSVGPNLFFARTGYFLDNKNVITYITGIDLNVYYTLLKSEKASLNVGPGITFQHRDYSAPEPVRFVSTDHQSVVDHSDKSGAIANLVYEGRISDAWNIGIKSSWQALGRLEAMTYFGIYGGLKF